MPGASTRPTHEGARPAAEVIDGWAIAFDEFLVAVGEIHVTADGGVVDLPGWYAFDLSAPAVSG